MVGGRMVWEEQVLWLLFWFLAICNDTHRFSPVSFPKRKEERNCLVIIMGASCWLLLWCCWVLAKAAAASVLLLFAGLTVWRRSQPKCVLTPANEQTKTDHACPHSLFFFFFFQQATENSPSSLSLITHSLLLFFSRLCVVQEETMCLCACTG